MQDTIPILRELLHAVDMRMDLEMLIEEGNYFKVGLCSWLDQVLADLIWADGFCLYIL